MKVKRYSPNLKIIIYLWGISVLFTQISCNVTKEIPAGQSILRKNSVEEVDKELDIIGDFFYKDELYKIPKQKPIKKILGVPVAEGIWAYYNTKRITQFTQTMKTKVGLAPIIFDSLKLETSKTSFQLYYFNNGYFDNKVEAKVRTKNKKTKVSYQITLNDAYKIDNVIVDTFTPIQKEIFKYNDESLVLNGEVFNIDNFIDERERITSVAKDNGYFTFSKNNVKYRFDTFKDTKKVNVSIKIEEESDTSNYQKYYVDSIYVQLNKVDQGIGDTGKVVETIIDNIHFFQTEPKIYKEDFLSKFIYKQDNNLYSRNDVQTTLRKFTGLNNFQLVNSSYMIVDPKKKSLNTLYSLTPYDKYSFRLGQSVYGSTLGFIGSELELSFTNNNLTKHADRLKLSLSGAAEFSFILNQNNNNNSGLVSRTDISAGAKYSIDKFLLPIINSNKQKYKYYRTELNAKYTYSKRLGFYDIHNLGVNAGEIWSKNGLSRFTYRPLLFNYIFIPTESVSTEFEETLDRNPFLKSSFTSSFILGSNFLYEYIKPIGMRKHLFKYNFDIETAGNTAYLLNEIINISDGDNISINGIDVSQYLMFQTQSTFSQNINKSTSMNYKLRSGIVLPYGNSDKAPYIKQFFIGGQNSLRGFQVRTIGPGSHNPDTALIRDQLGNIVFEGSAEYRFHIISFLKGALFTDFGNIWYSSEKYVKEKQSVFDFGEFYKQMYIGGGVGVRMDVDFFILRFDFGFPIRVPYLNDKDWVILDAKPFSGEWYRDNLVFNFAVGYPF